MNKHVDIQNWIPVGNFLMLKAAKLDNIDSPLYIKEFAESDCFEVINFGSSYKANDKIPVEKGDLVLVVEPKHTRSQGTEMDIGNEKVFFYPPKTIACVIKPDNSIIPANNFVLLEAIEADTKIGNIIIPASVEQKVTHATVAVIKCDSELGLKVGDEVIISKHTDNRVTLNGKTYIVANETELLAKV